MLNNYKARVSAPSSSMTLNHRINYEDVNRCCVNRESCCHTSWTFDILDKTKVDTRSKQIAFYFLKEYTLKIADFFITSLYIFGRNYQPVRLYDHHADAETFQ